MELTQGALDEMDRNARAYGFEVGKTGRFPEKFETLSFDNPFLVSTWRELIRDYVSVSEESNLVKHARRELEIIGEEPETIFGILRIMQAFSDMGHSGGSAPICIHWINELLQFKNLTPLTDDPEDWIHHTAEVWGETGGDGIWQNRRNSEAFSNDAGKTYYLLSEGGNDKNKDPLHTSLHKES